MRRISHYPAFSENCSLVNIPPDFVPFGLIPQSAVSHDLIELFDLAETRHMLLPVRTVFSFRNKSADACEGEIRGEKQMNCFRFRSTQAASGSRSNKAKAEDTGFYAPLIRKGSKLRLARPDERNPRRLANPQTEWDILHGLIMEFRKGDIPLVRAYLTRHAEGKEELFKDLLKVWTTESADETLRKEGQAMIFGLRL